ncbi:hypothetical protein B0H10DRAFT_1962136 [Mycena sp. CBHHK59/15]|nr:hypothetical protein B0H10DRAFT_1962136 [Mycena sp. CBHHK59/15]
MPLLESLEASVGHGFGSTRRVCGSGWPGTGRGLCCGSMRALSIGRAGQHHHCLKSISMTRGVFLWGTVWFGDGIDGVGMHAFGVWWSPVHFKHLKNIPTTCFFDFVPARQRRHVRFESDRGGEGNWTNHEKSQNHIDAVKIAGKARQITSFFGTKTVRTEQAGTSRGSSSSAAASSSRIGTASAPTPNGNSAQIIDGIMLQQLRLAISTLPLGIPLATATDLIATFAVDPVTLVGPGQDAWEDVIHNIFDVLMYDKGQLRNTLQLSQFIRRGDLGMVGFVNWLEKCLFVLNISANLVESRIERITQAMILLGARTTADLPLVPLDPIVPPAISPKPQGPTALMGCPGQELPLDGKASFLSYPLALHTHRELPWSVEFGRKLIIHSDQCKRHLQDSGVCYPCAKLLRELVVKGIIERNEDGNRPGSTFDYLSTITGSDSNADMSQLGNQLSAAVECDNILAEHPEWASDPRRIRLPVWQDVEGDVSAKIDHITPQSWLGDVHVKDVSVRTTWMNGRGIAEDELRAALLEPPFESMVMTGGYSIFCPFGNNNIVLINPPVTGERNEDVDESDIGQATNLTAVTALAATDRSGRRFGFPSVEGSRRISYYSGSTTKKQHKATILRIYSSQFSVAESRDHLKRVCGFSWHSDAVSQPSDANEAIPGEPMVLVQDPAAILVRSNGFVWLAVVSISGFTCSTKHMETLPKHLLNEPNVHARVQIMELVPTKNLPRADSEEGDWEWNGKFITTSGISKLCEVDRSLIQLLDPAVLPATNSSKNSMSTYHFKSVELVAIAASMEMRTRSTKKLPEILFGSTFPYRTSAGFTCFVCNREGSSLLQEEGLCTLCPSASLSIKSAQKLVEHMAIHILFNRNPPIDHNGRPCGFCLSTNFFCSVVLVKSKGGDGAIRIDMAKSRCPNLANLGLVTAAKSSERSPCTL